MLYRFHPISLFVLSLAIANVLIALQKPIQFTANFQLAAEIFETEYVLNYTFLVNKINSRQKSN